MKSDGVNLIVAEIVSLPVRGAWVEMLTAIVNWTDEGLSLPVRGAWVEIVGLRVCGKSTQVAPRAGSVG